MQSVLKCLLVNLMSVTMVFAMLSLAAAKPTTSDQASLVVKTWRSLDTLPMKSKIGKSVAEVETYKDDKGEAVYHVVYLKPSGFVIVPADDEVEPVIAFSSEGRFVDFDQNPLGALVKRDLPGRIAHVRNTSFGKSMETSALTSKSKAAAKLKWEKLQGAASGQEMAGVSTISDVRVAPIIQSKWNQTTYNGSNLYNYYTPNNYPSGCVATALSQLMRFHQYPTSTIGTASYAIKVNEASQTTNLMGGDGAGSAFNWAQMPLVPNTSVTDAQRQAIGRLMHDAGATVNMSYASGGSGTDTLKTANALKNSFGYSNAVKGYDYYNGGINIANDARNAMVNPNLDAGLPVLFGITGNSGGHAIVGDGYGYQDGTMYHHLNMGWSGSSDLWYNLPDIGTGYNFDSVYKVVYNVYPTGSGEIISGRILDSSNSGINAATVTASLNGSVVATTTSNSKGIYAFPKILSSSTYTIAATKTGYSFAAQTVTTGTSSDYTTTTGNKWGIALVGTLIPVNGVCGSSNGQSLDSAPVSGLCAVGTASVLAGTGPWTWTCNGINGGTVASCSTTPYLYVLNVTIAGSGGGNVTSNPAGISCSSGICSANFNSGSSVTLTATPNVTSTFFGWSGNCSGNGNCIVNMGAARSATATFSLIPKAMIGSTPYGSLTSAYAAVDSGATIEARNLEFIENLLLNRSVAFILKGGYANGYASRSGYTTLDGVLTIGSGRLIVDGLAIK